MLQLCQHQGLLILTPPQQSKGSPLLACLRVAHTLTPLFSASLRRRVVQMQRSAAALAVQLNRPQQLDPQDVLPGAFPGLPEVGWRWPAWWGHALVFCADRQTLQRRGRQRRAGQIRSVGVPHILSVIACRVLMEQQQLLPSPRDITCSVLCAAVEVSCRVSTLPASDPAAATHFVPYCAVLY